jgi:hypothetical protein
VECNYFPLPSKFEILEYCVQNNSNLRNPAQFLLLNLGARNFSRST